jgi:CheY-like chemotaxis protein
VGLPTEARSTNVGLPTEARSAKVGACFQLTLPAHAVVLPAESTGLPAAPASERPGCRQALVIEDEEPIRALLGRLLGRRDYTVTEASSCAEAKVLSEGKTFDLVLCDVRLSDGNGGDCLRHLRDVQPGLGRRFVFVTGDIAALNDAAREFGDMPVLTKPFTATDLDRVLGDVEVGV